MKDRINQEKQRLATESVRLTARMKEMSLEDFKKESSELIEKIRLLNESPEKYFTPNH